MNIDELIKNLQERREQFGATMEVIINHQGRMFGLNPRRSFPDHTNEDPLVLYTCPLFPPLS